jgi:hypothetical protein
LKEGNVWVAQCLDYDIAEQSFDIFIALERLGGAIRSTIFLEKIYKDISSTPRPAPDIYWKLAEARTNTEVKGVMKELSEFLFEKP